MRWSPQTFRLMLVTQKGTQKTQDYLDFVEKAVKGGVTCVQMREKSLSYEDKKTFIFALKEVLSCVPLIINDEVSLAQWTDGVHLGQSDGGIEEARLFLGPDKIIGQTINTEHEMRASRSLPLNYVGLALFLTPNKPNLTNAWGVQGLKKMTQLSVHPVVAIGGIEPNCTQEIIQNGASGVAAIGAFLREDPQRVAQKFRQAMEYSA